MTVEQQDYSEIKINNLRNITSIKDYLEKFECVKQVSGNKISAHMLLAATQIMTFLRKDLYKYQANIAENMSLDDSKKKRKLERTEKMLNITNKVMFYLEKKLSNNLFDYIKTLNLVDNIFIDKLRQSGYFEATTKVNNNLSRFFETSAYSSYNNEGTISLNINLRGNLAGIKKDELEKLSLVNLFTLNGFSKENNTEAGLMKTLILLHELAHVDFRQYEMPFTPTQGTFFDDAKKEKELIKAINDFGIVDFAGENKPNANKFRNLLNECHSDAMAVLILLKETPDELKEKVLKTIDDLYSLRKESFADAATLKVPFPYMACHIAIDMAREYKDKVKNFSPDEIRRLAKRIASDAAISLLPKIGKSLGDEFLNDLIPSQNYNTALPVVDMAHAKDGKMSKRFESHPFREVIIFDMIKTKLRYSHEAKAHKDIKDGWGDMSFVDDLHKKRKDLSLLFSRLSFHIPMDDVITKTCTIVPKGLSLDEQMARLNILQKAGEQWQKGCILINSGIKAIQHKIYHEEIMEKAKREFGLKNSILLRSKSNSLKI